MVADEGEEAEREEKEVKSAEEPFHTENATDSGSLDRASFFTLLDKLAHYNSK